MISEAKVEEEAGYNFWIQLQRKLSNPKSISFNAGINEELGSSTRVKNVWMPFSVIGGLPKATSLATDRK